MPKQFEHVLSEDEYQNTGGKIGTVLKRVFGFSRHEISRLKFDGQILFDGARMHVNQSIHAGDTLTVVFPEEICQDEVKTDYIPEILYEDEDLVIVNKPAGMAVHASHGHLDDSLGSALHAYYRKQGIEFTVRCIGRLDKDVSGVMLYAKNQPAAARLTRQRQEGILKKTYTAFASGIFPGNEIVLEDAIEKVAGERARSVSEDGKRARTKITVLACYEHAYSRLSVQIETGRTHQIRVHCAASGHPLLGDTLYGGDTALINRCALHCSQIDLISPFSQQPVSIQAPLPEDLQKLL